MGCICGPRHPQVKLPSQAEFLESVENWLEKDPNSVTALQIRASIKANSSDPSLRDGQGALEDIERVIEMEEANGKLNGGRQHRLYLRIRAAAYAELRQFDLAVESAQAALDLAVTKTIRFFIERELECYKKRKRCRTALI